jgi:CxxC-x17-CxxC domain-containing protein
MTAITPTSTTSGTRTAITCTKCGKAASVPFTPSPGRPVFCRDCFSKTSSAPRPSFRDGDAPPVPRAPVPGARKRMMAQGRKTHFIYDARAVLAGIPGGMDDKDNRAFLEGLFARGARISTQDAQVFLEQKVTDGDVTHEQAIELGRLIDKYSFFR